MISRISSCCFTGTWILYSNVNYNNQSFATSYWAFGQTHCESIKAL